MKQKELVNKSNISDLESNSELNAKYAALATKAELKALQGKIVKLEVFDSSYFQSKIFDGDDRFQNMFVYQPILKILELKNKVTDYVLSWNSKGVFTWKIKPLYTAFLHSIKISGSKVGIKFDKDLLTVEQNNYKMKVANAYIVYELDPWPINSVNNFKLKNCLFGATSIVKNSDKEK